LLKPIERVEIVAILGSLGLLLLVVELVRRKKLAEGYSLLWLLTAIVLLGLSLWRSSLDALARLVGIFYPPSALFVVAFGFVLIILLNFSALVSRLSYENKELAQRVAILDWRLRRLEGTAAPGPAPQVQAEGEYPSWPPPPPQGGQGETGQVE
jgi:hypothetical protein